MAFTLALNTNPLVNRFAEPDDLITMIARDLRIRDVQLTHEFLNPGWSVNILHPLVKQMQIACRRTGVRITSGMTGPYGRLNHFGHPNAEVRLYYVQWFKNFAQIIADLGGSAIGTQFAIFTYKDFDNQQKYDDLIKRAIECWVDLAEYSAKVGLDFLFWEPMSINREFGATIKDCLALQNRLTSTKMAIPMWMMADIDHGDVSSANVDDFNPYAWARAVAMTSPIIHIKQSSANKSGHRPFIKAYNKTGLIQPKKLLAEITAGGGTHNQLCLELSFKEREPMDRQVIPHIAESIEFWSSYIDTGINNLNV